MRDTVLMFLLKYGHFLRVPVTVRQAEAIIKGWATNSLPPVIGTNIHPLDLDAPPEQTSWWVKVEDIVVIHTVDPRELQGMQQSVPAGPAPTFRTLTSGRN